MSDGSLSQEEIDALLMGDAPAGGPASPGAGQDKIDESLKKKLVDLFGEAGNNRNSILSELMTRRVKISEPRIEATSRDELILKLPEEIVEVRVDFQGGMEGKHAYLLSGEDAIRVAIPVIGHDDLELESTTINAVGEAMGQFASATANALGEKLDQTIIADSPNSTKTSSSDTSIQNQDSVTLAYDVDMEESGSVTIYEMFDEQLALKLANSLASGNGTASSSLEDMTGLTALQEDDSAFQQLMPNLDLPETPNPSNNPQGANAPNVLGVELSELSPAAGSGEKRNIGLLMDVSMELTVELDGQNGK